MVQCQTILGHNRRKQAQRVLFSGEQVRVQGVDPAAGNAEMPLRRGLPKKILLYFA